MDLVSLLLFLVSSTVLGLAVLCFYHWFGDLRESWRSPLGRDHRGDTVVSNLLYLVAASVIGCVFWMLGTWAWASFSMVAAMAQLSALIVGIVGYTLAAIGVVGGFFSARDAYLARHSPDGKSPDGRTEQENLEGLLGAVIVALLAPVLTTALVRVCLW